MGENAPLITGPADSILYTMLAPMTTWNQPALPTSSYPYPFITVEPLEKDPLNKGHLVLLHTNTLVIPLNKGHLSIKDTWFCSILIHW